MNRKDAINAFEKKVVNKLTKICKEEFKENLNKNHEKLKEILVDGLRLLAKKVKDIQTLKPDYKLYLIEFEFLRVNVLNNTYKIYISGYNQSLFLDELAVNEEISLKFLFEPCLKLKNELLSKKAVYIGKINEYDIKIIIMKTAAECFEMIKEYARESMWNIDEENILDEDIMGNYYFIKWAEYHEKGEVIFSMDTRKKSIEQFADLKKYPEEKLMYTYTVWRNVDFKDCDVSKQKMFFINFMESTLTNINFESNYIIKSQFKKTEINKCCFDSCIAIKSSFENSRIKNSSFENADCRLVSFKNAELKEVNFKNCNLSNTSFINCKFKDVSFEDSVLEGAVFNENDIPFIHLSAEQLQSIYAYGGDC